MSTTSRLEALGLVRAAARRDYETGNLIFNGAEDQAALTTSLALLCASVLKQAHGEDFDDVMDLITEFQFDEAPA